MTKLILIDTQIQTLYFFPVQLQGETLLIGCKTAYIREFCVRKNEGYMFFQAAKSKTHTTELFTLLLTFVNELKTKTMLS